MNCSVPEERWSKPFIFNCVHPPVQLDYISVFFPFQLLLSEFIPYPENPGTLKDDSNFKMAKLDRILNLLIFAVVCVRKKYWYTAVLGQQSCKTQGGTRTNNPACVELLLASTAPGIMHSVAT